MSRLKNRVGRLEDAQGEDDVTVVAVVPAGWSKQRQETEVKAAALAHGAKEPFKLWIFECSETEDVRLQWIGDVADMLAHIAKNGRTIIDRNREKNAGR